MNPLKYAATNNGKVSQEAIDTFAGIAQSIHEHSLKSPWDRANTHMKEALKGAKDEARNKKEFLVLAKQITGIAKSTHPLLIWCVANWY